MRTENNIPDISNIKKGDTFTGGRRRANMVRAVGLYPYNWQSNQGKAQEKTLRQYFNWEDDKENMILKITEIYDKPKERMDSRYNSIYRDYIDYLLLNKLIEKHNDNEEYSDTFGNFFKTLNVIPLSFKRGSSNDYKEMDRIDFNELCTVRDIIYFRFISVIKGELQRLEDRGIIRVDHNDIIILDNEYQVKAKDYYLSFLDEKIAELEKKCGCKFNLSLFFKKSDVENLYALTKAEQIGEQMIQRARDYACFRLNIDSEQDAIIRDMMLAYTKLCNYYAQTEYGWKGFYRALDIKLICSEEEVMKIIRESKFFGQDIKATEHSFNKLLIEKIDETFENKLANKSISEKLIAIKDIVIGNEYSLHEDMKRIQRGQANLSKYKSLGKKGKKVRDDNIGIESVVI